MSAIDRDEAAGLLARGIPVIHQGREYRQDERRRVPELPPGGEFFAARDSKGGLTRAGMEHALRAGGSVLHRGRVIERVEELPDEVTLAAGDEARLRSVMEAHDEQVRKSLEAREQARRELERAAETRARQGEQSHRETARRGEGEGDQAGRHETPPAESAGQGQQPQEGPQGQSPEESEGSPQGRRRRRE